MPFLFHFGKNSETAVFSSFDGLPHLMFTLRETLLNLRHGLCFMSHGLSASLPNEHENPVSGHFHPGLSLRIPGKIIFTVMTEPY